MKSIYILLLCIVITSCSTKTFFEDVYLNGDKYCLKGTESPVTGQLIVKFESGNVSNSIEMKNGIPDGGWLAYGYDNEIVQQGYYKPLILERENQFEGIDLIRLNVCFIKEGEFEFTNVILITDSDSDSIPLNTKSLIHLFLKEKRIDIKGDSINRLVIARGELEN